MNLTYYNDNAPYVAKWLWNLIEAGEISNGAVDLSNIQDVQPETLEGFNRCHFFAGIGGWDLALKLAGWPEYQEVWTGSCPCQPFSVAGKRKGINDPRHLWPEWFRLIRECRPPVLLGEQVSSKDGRKWLNGVFTDLESLGYAVAGADLCAAGVGAPHIRQRLFWCAQRLDDSTSSRWISTRQWPEDQAWHETRLCRSELRCEDGRVAYSEHSQRRSELQTDSDSYRRNGCNGGMGNSNHDGSQGCCFDTGEREDQLSAWTPSKFNGLDDSACEQVGRARFPWQDCDYISCLDGKTRRIGTGIQPLAYGIPARVAKLRAIGNSIVPQVAAVFIKSVMDILYG